MTFDINLEWLAFNVDMNTVDTWMKANAGANYCGLSANDFMQVHFTADPGNDVAIAVEGYWTSLNTGSPEATNYMTASARLASVETAKAAKIASATAKLEALGLTADEIAAIIS